MVREWNLGDSVVLSAGCKILSDGEPSQRDEGVTLVLRGPAMGAWKNSGNHGAPDSSQLSYISATERLALYMYYRAVPQLKLLVE